METKRFIMIKAKEKMYWQNLRYLDFERYRLPDFVSEASETMEYCNYDLKCEDEELTELAYNIVYLLQDGGIVAEGVRGEDESYISITYDMDKVECVPLTYYFELEPDTPKVSFEEIKDLIKSKKRKSMAKEDNIFKLTGMSLEDTPAAKRPVPAQYAQYFSRAEDIADFEIKGHKFVLAGDFHYSREAAKDYIARNGGQIVDSISDATDMLVIGLENTYAEGSKELARAVGQKRKRGNDFHILSDSEFRRWQYMKFIPKKRPGLIVKEQTPKRETMVFGHVPGALDEYGDAKPFEWIVIAENDSDILLLSKDIVAYLPFDEDPKESMPSWKTSSIRKWLNEEFLPSVFAREEQRWVKMVQNSNCVGSEKSIFYDKVFLLGENEVKRYLFREMGDFDIECSQAPGWILRSGKASGIRYCTRDGLSRKFADQQQDYGIRPAIWKNKNYELSTSKINTDYRWQCVQYEMELKEIKRKAAEKEPGKDRILFGHYPMEPGSDADGPIEWIVIAEKGDAQLLLSKNIIDHKPFYDESISFSYSWEKCSLREWLNGEFLEKSFTEEEQKRIKAVTNTDNALSGKTVDRIFLLSEREARRYLKAEAGDFKVKNTNYAADIQRKLGYKIGGWILRSGRLDGLKYCLSDGVQQDRMYLEGSQPIRPALWRLK